MSEPRAYGWIRDIPDHRDLIFKVTAPVALPPKVDLQSGFPDCYDQGQLGSCTGNGVAGVVQFAEMKQGKSTASDVPSRLFIYYNERAMEGTVNSDSGAQIRDGIKVVASFGSPLETLWPYNIKQFKTKPPIPVYLQARRHKAVQYSRIQSMNDMQQCLAQGFPFVFGFTVYESFESQQVAKTGMVPMPSRRERAVGGHCVVCIGYDDSKQLFKIRNSWGTRWGDNGHCYMPYQYLTNPNLSSDFWNVTVVS